MSKQMTFTDKVRKALKILKPRFDDLADGYIKKGCALARTRLFRIDFIICIENIFCTLVKDISDKRDFCFFFCFSVSGENIVP